MSLLELCTAARHDEIRRTVVRQWGAEIAPNGATDSAAVAVTF
jgi:hypothetical protein